MAAESGGSRRLGNLARDSRILRYAPAALLNRSHIIFVDYENIQKLDFGELGEKPLVLYLVLGKGNKNLPTTLVRQLVRPSIEVRLIETEQAGKNALDFVLSYYVGVQTAENPQGHYEILSKDKGFDALVHHLKGKGISIARVEELSRKKASQGGGKVKAANTAPPTLTEQVRRVAAHFSEHATARPKRKKTLQSSIGALFGKKLSETEVEETIKALCEKRLIEITEKGAVTYFI